MPMAFSYARWSSSRQSLGDSQRRQIEAARAYAAQHGLDLDESFRDEARSGWRGDHVGPKGALGGFFQRVNNGDVPKGSTLIVEAMDRLSRQEVTTALKQFLDLLHAGITIVTLMDSKTYTKEAADKNPTDLMCSIMLMSTAYRESALKSERLKKRWEGYREEAEKKGTKVPRGSLPGWLDWNDERNGFLIDEGKVATINLMLDRILAGHGMTSIARMFNCDKRPIMSLDRKKNREQSGWSTASVSHLLNNDALLGTFQPHTGTGGRNRKPLKEPFLNYFPVVVDADKLIRARAEARARHNKPIGNPRSANIFAGVAVCSECGGRMEFQRGDAKSRPSYLRCAQWLRGRGCSNASRYHYTNLERAILSRVANVALEQEEGHSAVANEVSQRGALVHQKDVVQRIVDRLYRQVEEEDDPPKGILERIRAREAEVKGLQNQIIALDDQIAAQRARPSTSEVQRTIRDVWAVFEAGTDDEPYEARIRVQMLLRQIVERLTLSPTMEPRNPFWRLDVVGGWAYTTSSVDDWINMDVLARIVEHVGSEDGLSDAAREFLRNAKRQLAEMPPEGRDKAASLITSATDLDLSKLGNTLFVRKPRHVGFILPSSEDVIER